MAYIPKKQSTALTENDEQLVRRLIEKITIYENKIYRGIQISGVTVDVND